MSLYAVARYLWFTFWMAGALAMMHHDVVAGAGICLSIASLIFFFQDRSTAP